MYVHRGDSCNVYVSVIYMKIFFLKIEGNKRFTENRNPHFPNSKDFCSEATISAELLFCVLYLQGAGLKLSLRSSCFPSYQDLLIHHFRSSSEQCQAIFTSPMSIVHSSKEKKKEPWNYLLCFKLIYLTNSFCYKYLEFRLFSFSFSLLLLISVVNAAEEKHLTAVLLSIAIIVLLNKCLCPSMWFSCKMELGDSRINLSPQLNNGFMHT